MPRQKGGTITGQVHPSRENMTRSASVVMPTYNGVAFIDDALESAYSQTLPPREIIVVDDNSSDGTPDLIEQRIPEAPLPVRLIRLRKNSGGPAHPINVGIEAASGEYIAVLDQDDTFAPNKLEEQVDAIERHPDLSLVFSSRGHQGGPPEGMTQHLSRVLEGAGTWDRECLKIEGPDALRLFMEFGNLATGYPGFLFRRADWERVGRCDEGLFIASDYDLICGLCALGPVGFLPRVHYLRREHDANMCNNALRMKTECLVVRARYILRDDRLANDERMSRDFGEWSFNLAFDNREAGRYGDALKCLRLSRQVSGLDARMARALVVMLPHLLHRWFLRHRPA